MNRRERLKIMVNIICRMGIILSNVGLFLCSILMFRGIITKQGDIIIFSVQVFIIFMITLQLSKYFKNYLD
ncbi:hypothetical protein [Clostridium sp.]|uniref:hypothetical protein n=1 Tax=Clostridium sp. TaxID=1506 RepID=UPI003D6CEB4B